MTDQVPPGEMPPGWESQVPPGPYGQPGYPPFGQPGYGQPGYGSPGGWRPAPAPGGIPLRPLGLGDMLNGAIVSARRNPAATFGLAVIIMTIYGVLYAIFQAVARSPLAQLQSMERALNNGQNLSQQQTHQLASIFGVLLPVGATVFVVSLVLTSTLTGMLSAVIGRGVLGRRIGLGEAWQAGRVGSVVLTSLLLLLIGICVPLPVAVVVVALILLHMTPVAVLIGVLGGIASLVFGLLLIVRLSLTLPALVLERISPTSAVKRSFELSHGNFWRLFGIQLLTSIIAGVAALVLTVPFTLVGGLAGGPADLFGASATASTTGLLIAAVGQIVASAVTAPITAGVVVLLYTDLRMRREGLDSALRTAAQSDGLTGEEFDSAWRPPAT